MVETPRPTEPPADAPRALPLGNQAPASLSPAKPSPADLPPPGLPPLRFSLAALLLTTAGICLLLGAMIYAGPLGAFALLLFALSVLAHVAGNSIGTFLRDTGGRSLPDDLPPVRSMRARPGPADFAEATELRGTADLSATLVVAAGVGAAAGALGGGGLLCWANWDRLTLFNVAAGALAFAIIGAIGGCFVGCFVRVGLAALRQSAATASRERASRTPAPGPDANSECGIRNAQ